MWSFLAHTFTLVKCESCVHTQHFTTDFNGLSDIFSQNLKKKKTIIKIKDQIALFMTTKCKRSDAVIFFYVCTFWIRKNKSQNILTPKVQSKVFFMNNLVIFIWSMIIDCVFCIFQMIVSILSRQFGVVNGAKMVKCVSISKRYIFGEYHRSCKIKQVEHYLGIETNTNTPMWRMANVDHIPT